MGLGRLTKGLWISGSIRGEAARKLVPAALLLALGLLFTDVAVLSPLFLALAVILYTGVLYAQWRAEQNGRAAEDWRRHEEHKEWVSTLPIAGRVLWYALWVILLAFFAWTAYRFDW